MEVAFQINPRGLGYGFEPPVFQERQVNSKVFWPSYIAITFTGFLNFTHHVVFWNLQQKILLHTAYAALVDWLLLWLKLALSNRPNWLGIPHLFAQRQKRIQLSQMLFSEYRTMDKSKYAVIVTVHKISVWHILL